jgi:hypothetical protein
MRILLAMSKNKSFLKQINQIERFFGGLKFAVFLILSFTFVMIIGTFQESYHGAEYANRLIYKAPLFMLLQFLLFICIFMAALLRLPPKKRLYGFYTIHSGLILVLAGSFITFYAGIDGSISLPAMSPSRYLTLPDDIVVMDIQDYENPSASKSITYPLPFKASEVQLNDEYEGVKFLKFLPFSDPVLNWVEPKNPVAQAQRTLFHSGQYSFINDFVAQELTLSLHPEVKDFQSTTKLGPLSVHYLPTALGPCFSKNNPSGHLLWNQVQGKCFTLEEKNIAIKKDSNKNSIIEFFDDGKKYLFHPLKSPWPLKNPTEYNQGSVWRIFSKKLFEDSPHVFLFGKSVAHYDEKWIFQHFNNSEEVELPWMNLRVKLLAHHEQLIPALIPKGVVPIQDNNEIIQGKEKAILVGIGDEQHWIRSNQPIKLFSQGKSIRLSLTKRTLKLPYEFTLTKFKMDKNPGTNSPASYESFVKLFTNEGAQKHHVYMNNPLKYAGFTFYQASYFQDESRNYGSVLSVNFDPGRFWKYFGSLILVLGSTWHFYINRKKVKTSPA